MKKALIALSASIVVVAAGAAGWWYATDRGWIAGKLNSPRAENFGRTLDEHLARTAESVAYPRQCVIPANAPPDYRGYPDMRFDNTPTGYRVIVDARTDPKNAQELRLEFFKKHGLLDSTQGADGRIEYSMTWKGFAASNNGTCFHVAGVERKSKIIGFEKKRVVNGVEIYEVTAKPVPVFIEPWAQTQEFRDLFFGNLPQRDYLEPDPVTYELARGETGFTVLSERGRPLPNRRVTDDAAITAKVVGKLTADRVKETLDAYLAKEGAARNRVCLGLPSVPHEADEAVGANLNGVGDSSPSQEKITYTFYNVLTRNGSSQNDVLRGYDLMKRLESLHLATSELLQVSEFRGRPTAGAVRFELTGEFLARLRRGYPMCYPLGTLEVDEIVFFQPFSEFVPRPRFVARMKFKQSEDGNVQRVINEFGHLARVAAIGVAMQGTLRYGDGELQVENARVMMPPFFPDVSNLALPVVDAPPRARPAAQGPISSHLDFSSTEGFARTCRRVLQADPKKLKDDPERVAYFICGAVGLAKDAAIWFGQIRQSLESTDPAARRRIRGQPEKYLARMSELRGVLEGVRGKGPYLTIQPGSWQIDFDGDGKVSLFEKYLFWVPKRGLQAALRDAPNSEELYRSRYTSPVINVDQSDVYWAIAYVNFAEAALHVALAYDWYPARYEEATLLEPRRISGSAYQRMIEGIRYSMRLRESVLQETHDKNEWIGNPRQADTSFPLRMDVDTFATWRSLLGELDSVLRGNSLLGGRVDSGERTRGLRDLSFGMCPSGEGLDVRGLFVTPISRLFDPKQLAARCAKPTAARPLSGLASLISASIKRNANASGGAESGEWTLLRNLYWIN